MKWCSESFNQELMKSMDPLSETNSSVLEFDGSRQPPPLLLSSQDDWCYFSYASIKHMTLYLSVLVFIINPSNTFPCNFLQIDVLYQVPPIIQSELCFSVSYCNSSCVSFIYNIPTCCNIVFNTKVVIISLYVVFKLSTSMIVYFPQLLHPLAIFRLYFSRLPTDYTNI